MIYNIDDETVPGILNVPNKNTTFQVIIIGTKIVKSYFFFQRFVSDMKI